MGTDGWRREVSGRGEASFNVVAETALDWREWNAGAGGVEAHVCCAGGVGCAFDELIVVHFNFDVGVDWDFGCVVDRAFGHAFNNSLDCGFDCTVRSLIYCRFVFDFLLDFPGNRGQSSTVLFLMSYHDWHDNEPKRRRKIID